MNEYRGTSAKTRELIELFDKVREEHRKEEERLVEVRGDALDKDELAEMIREHGELEDAAADAVRQQRLHESRMRDEYGGELCAVMGDVVVESYASLATFGEQADVKGFSDTLGASGFALPPAKTLREINESDPSWETILLEEVFEAGEKSGVDDELELEAELIQVASVASKWVALLRKRRRDRGAS